MGGSNDADIITNLQALCRECHTKFGDQKRFKEMLKDKHRKALEMRQK
jgi:5-methylcytosine-specific restriction endonuclease McrA